MNRKSFVFLTALLFVAVGMLGCGDDPATSTIVITNLKNNATLEAGFLTGHVSGATALSYEVSWDDGGSWSPVAGTDAFRIRIPLSWRQGWYYSFRIRAVTSAGTAGEREFTIRKGPNRDWNGDGYPDLVIGEPAWDSYTGQVDIFNGGPGGPAGSASVILPFKINTATEGDRSPNFIQADFNGDGYGDIAFFDYYDGELIRIYSGSSNTLVQTSVTSNGSLTSRLAAGDFNGDGYTDLAVSSDGSPTRRVIVLLSEGAGGIPSTDLSTDTPDWQTDGADSLSIYGSSLATGDFNRDGYDDLAVGEKYMNDTPGSVHVFHGSGTGLAGSPAVSLTGPANGSRFGDTAVAGDFNGDGYADLAVGAFALDFIAQDVTNCGYAAVYHGGASGIAATPAWAQ